METVEELANSDSMEVDEYTPGMDIYSLVPLFFSLLQKINLKAIAHKDDYGNVTFEVEDHKP